MAVGVPEKDVFDAADRVLMRGERPTVERVRLELGRGSPARVGGLLDKWWDRLASRLSSETRLPDLPPEVSRGFIGIWNQAIQAAEATSELATAAQRQVLEDELMRVAQIEDDSRREVAVYRQRAEVERTGRESAETRLADLTVFLDQCQNELGDLRDRGMDLLNDRDAAREQVKESEREMHKLRVKAEQDRLTLESYVRGVEDRAHQEVDRLREESKLSATQLKEATRQVGQLNAKLENTQAKLSESQQATAAVLAQNETLTMQLSRVTRVSPYKRKPRVLKSR